MHLSKKRITPSSTFHNGEHELLKTTKTPSISGQILEVLDLLWHNAQFPDSPLPVVRHKGVDTVQPLSPFTKERREKAMKRECLEQGLIYVVGFVVVVAALPFLRYMAV